MFLGGVIAAVLVLIASALVADRIVFARRIAREVDQLFAAATESRACIVSEQDIVGLPSLSSGGSVRRTSSAPRT